jgi:hypothetical protein
MMQDTGLLRNEKDQFYTKESVAKICICELLKIPNIKKYTWIEPSAGNGSFFNNVPLKIKKIGIDIDPKSPEIIKQDFLSFHPSSKKNIVFGNPPFGRQSSLAKKFIKHACKFSQIIAFILPLSFLKPSMTSAFPQNFHLILTQHLKKNSFELNGNSYDVPCIFQIWEKKDFERPKEKKIKEEGFKYVTSDFDIAFRRVGGLAGKCYPVGEFSRQSHYFLKFDDKYNPYIEQIIILINSHDFPKNTVGPKSISKSEANKVINSFLSSL